MQVSPNLRIISINTLYYDVFNFWVSNFYKNQFQILGIDSRAEIWRFFVLTLIIAAFNLDFSCKWREGILYVPPTDQSQNEKKKN